MLFQIYGETAGFQLLGWLLVFVGLIVAVIISHIASGGLGRFPSLGEMCSHFTMLAKKMPFVISLNSIL